VCPACQAGSSWTEELDRCQRCASVRLVRRLGDVECRECGFVVAQEEEGGVVPGDRAGAPLDAPAGPPGEASAGSVAPCPGSGQAPGLAEEVARALERVLGRSTRKPPASAALLSRVTRPGGARPPSGGQMAATLWPGRAPVTDTGDIRHRRDAGQCGRIAQG
jgi:hypothetical protein